MSLWVENRLKRVPISPTAPRCLPDGQGGAGHAHPRVGREGSDCPWPGPLLLCPLSTMLPSAQLPSNPDLDLGQVPTAQ